MLNLRKENFEIVKGDTLVFFIEVVDADTDICSDLSDWTGTLTIKETVTDTNNEAKVSVNPYDHPDADAENGIIYWKVPSADTNLLTVHTDSSSISDISLWGIAADPVTNPDYVIPLYAQQVRGAVLTNVECDKATLIASAMRNSYQCSGTGLRMYQHKYAIGIGAFYGLLVDHCQNLQMKGDFFGTRHGVAIGGSGGWVVW